MTLFNFGQNPTVAICYVAYCTLQNTIEAQHTTAPERRMHGGLGGISNVPFYKSHSLL